MQTSIRLLTIILLTILLSPPLTAAPADFSKRYRATMTWSQTGLPTSCSPQDVWQLKSFRLTAGKSLNISTKKATVAFGVYETNALWAVVFPDEPKPITSASNGNREIPETILLRFSPAELCRIFPKKTIIGPGRSSLRAKALRIFKNKIGYKWFTPSGNTTIVAKGICLVDMDMQNGVRRFFEIDMGKRKADYIPKFENSPIPPDPPILSDDALNSFDEAWETFDLQYAKFIHLPAVDWKELRKQYRKQAAEVETTFELAALIADMLAHLEDLHIWVKAGNDWLPGYDRPRSLNANWQACLKTLPNMVNADQSVAWSKTKDGIGYIAINTLSDPKISDMVDEALEQLADTWSLIIDIRFNGGGDETLGRKIASRFVDQKRVYSTNQYRNGPAHTDLGEVLKRELAPGGPWRYESPIVAVWGQKTFSSAESMALMLAQCPNVTSMGDRTGGSSANPRQLNLECGITINVPRWVDMDPEGQPIENVGVPPQKKLNFKPDQFTNTSDPVLISAIKYLQKTPKSRRKPGKR